MTPKNTSDFSDEELDELLETSEHSEESNEVPLPDESVALSSRHCDQGCGRMVEEELADEQTTCATCMNELQGDDDALWDSYETSDESDQ
jgi:hypothetical protein